MKRGLKSPEGRTKDSDPEEKTDDWGLDLKMAIRKSGLKIPT